MKLYKVVGIIVLFITVSLTLFIVFIKYSPNANNKIDMVSNTTSSDSDDKSLVDLSKRFSAKEIKNMMGEQDSKWREDCIHLGRRPAGHGTV